MKQTTDGMSYVEVLPSSIIINAGGVDRIKIFGDATLRTLVEHNRFAKKFREENENKKGKDKEA